MKTFRSKAGFTLVEMMVAVAVGAICMLIIFNVIWSGTRLVTRNLAVNLAHMNVAISLQRLTDDMHMAMVTPRLTGTLAPGAVGTVPPGYSGTNAVSSQYGKLTSWTPPPIVTGTGPAEGVQLYLMVNSSYAVTTPYGTYSSSKTGFAVYSGTYNANSTSIQLEVNNTTEQALITSSTNGMRLCIPSAGVLATGSNYLMMDLKITSVSIGGSPGSNPSTSTLVATCSLSGPLGVVIQTNGTRGSMGGATPIIMAYLVAPVNYLVCGSDLIRLNYDGTWKRVMRNVMPTTKGLTQAKPFSMPWPYVTSFLSSVTDGRRAVRVRLAASNPDYTTVTTATNDSSIQFRGMNSDMVIYDMDIWSRMQLAEEIVR